MSTPPPASSSRRSVNEPSGPGPIARPKKRRRGLAAVIVGGSVILLAIILVVADFAVRAYAEGRVVQAVEQNLPENVTGTVTATIGGGSFLWQYLTGSFSEVTVASSDLTVDGQPLQVSIVANDVSTDASKPVPHATATLTIDQDALNSFVSIPGSDTVTLGDGTIGYSGEFRFFGVPYGYDVSATAVPQGPNVVLTPSGATLNAAGGSLDVSAALKVVVQKPISICVAQYLPQGVQLTSITPTNGSVTVTADATDLTLSQEALSTTGSCG